MVGLVWLHHYSYLFEVPHWTPADEDIAGLGKKLGMLALTKYVG